jgi:hypothetical protein
MSLISNFIFLILFGLLGFFVEKIWKINPFKYWTLFGTITVLGSLFLVYVPVIFNPDDIANNIDRLTMWLVNILPGVIFGDLAGQIVSRVARR